MTQTQDHRPISADALDRDSFYIDGRWARPATGDVIEVVSPHTEQVVARVPEGRPADIDAADVAGNTPLHLAVQGGKGCEKVVLLLVQHAATIARNALGLTPRDYALDPETHDTLKVQELKQGFELRYDLLHHPSRWLCPSL